MPSSARARAAGTRSWAPAGVWVWLVCSLGQGASLGRPIARPCQAGAPPPLPSPPTLPPTLLPSVNASTLVAFAAATLPDLLVLIHGLLQFSPCFLAFQAGAECTAVRADCARRLCGDHAHPCFASNTCQYLSHSLASSTLIISYFHASAGWGRPVTRGPWCPRAT